MLELVLDVDAVYSGQGYRPEDSSWWICGVRWRLCIVFLLELRNSVVPVLTREWSTWPWPRVFATLCSYVTPGVAFSRISSLGVPRSRRITKERCIWRTALLTVCTLVSVVTSFGSVIHTNREVEIASVPKAD